MRSATSISSTKSDIAAVAYQLWLENDCPAGSGQEDWFRAEALLKNAFVAKCEELPRPRSIPNYDTRTESDMLVEFGWDGHWEVWESEWGGARWIRDTPRIGISSRAA